MNVYVLGTRRDATVAVHHRSVLRSSLAAIWGTIDVQFHGQETAAFTPDECTALLLAAGTLPASPCDAKKALGYVEAMHWFSESIAGLAVGAPEDFDHQAWQRYIPVLNNLKILTVRDRKSSRILRSAGIKSPVLTCADLAYLTPTPPRSKQKEVRRPVLGILGETTNEIAAGLRELENDFELRWVSPANFGTIDVCLATQLHAVILSVLHEIPFAVAGHDKTVASECEDLGYPAISNIREAWSERLSLRELIRQVRTRRGRLAKRNIELLRTALYSPSLAKPVPLEKGRETLVVWAAPDEYWDEIESFLDGMGAGFDCLVPANCQVSPAGVRKRFPIPAGALMHWAMLPMDLKHHIQNRYDNVVVCHALNGSNNGTHLAEIASQTARHAWEFRLWTHSCESYS